MFKTLVISTALALSGASLAFGGSLPVTPTQTQAPFVPPSSAALTPEMALSIAQLAISLGENDLATQLEGVAPGSSEAITIVRQIIEALAAQLPASLIAQLSDAERQSALALLQDIEAIIGANPALTALMNALGG